MVVLKESSVYFCSRPSECECGGRVNLVSLGGVHSFSSDNVSCHKSVCHNVP